MALRLIIEGFWAGAINLVSRLTGSSFDDEWFEKQLINSVE